MSTEKVLQPKKIFEVMFGEKFYDVYDIEGKEHAGYNGEPKTWWIYYSERLPEGMIPPADSPEWEPWSKSIKRLAWNIRLKTRNYSKEKWGDTQFRSSDSCEMWCNGRLIYSFGTHGLDFAFAKCQYLMVALLEHPFNFLDSKKENGRKIWWYNLPAFVRVSEYYTWEINIIPDYTTTPKNQWWAEYKRRSIKDYQSKQDEEFDQGNFDELESQEYINWGDAFSDGHIDWFRNDPPADKKPDPSAFVSAS
jgi:hypothetical protein